MENRYLLAGISSGLIISLFIGFILGALFGDRDPNLTYQDILRAEELILRAQDQIVLSAEKISKQSESITDELREMNKSFITEFELSLSPEQKHRMEIEKRIRALERR